MRKYIYLVYDLACVAAALVAALYLRHGIPLIQEGRPEDLYLLFAVTMAVAFVVFSLMKIHTSMWRYTSSAELMTLMIAVAVVVLVTNSSLFLISRLEMMPRSVPPMHWGLAVVAMAGSRLLTRKLFGPARDSKQGALKQHVLIVGVGHTAELYLQFIKRIVRHHVIVEGLIDSDPTLTHRIFQRHEILGTMEDLPQILEKFLVHGIQIRQIVLTQMFDDLPSEEQQQLLDLENKGLIEIVHFAKHMAPQARHGIKKNTSDFYHKLNAIDKSAYEKPPGIYPYFKRFIDIVIGLVLILTLLPLMMITCLIVALDVGFPVIFWQQRPGLYGRPFRLVKFRTMRQAGRRLNEDRLSHKSGDTLRTTLIGKWLRQLRLDELPQLFHIVGGSMSLVGPRPLLPEDQPARGQLRLSVRPGVTGWAQIHGGDALTPQEKLELDLWYIRHMSLWLDLKILLRTLIVIWKEDRRRL